jgi:thymidylate synthase
MHETTIIHGRNVNEVYAKGVKMILEKGEEEDSRLGRVLVAPGPVISTYYRPDERVLFTKYRDANPFFHLMEAIWMLAGEQAAKWPTYFNKQMAEYANHRGNYDGAYGYRWRRMFGKDQITEVVKELKTDPKSRRAVIGMWTPDVDLRADSKDIPCNTHIYFDARGGQLNMTVCCRSNDAIWGAYGANAVHMSILQEIVAAGVGIPLGHYRQMSNNLHIYMDIPKISYATMHVEEDNRYTTHPESAMPLMNGTDVLRFLSECEIFLKHAYIPLSYGNEFLSEVCVPMYLSWVKHKELNYGAAIDYANAIGDYYWRTACLEWLTRRITNENCS